MAAVLTRSRGGAPRALGLMMPCGRRIVDLVEQIEQNQN
jgi:hypothetical protein